MDKGEGGESLHQKVQEKTKEEKKDRDHFQDLVNAEDYDQMEKQLCTYDSVEDDDS